MTSFRSECNSTHSEEECLAQKFVDDIAEPLLPQLPRSPISTEDFVASLCAAIFKDGDQINCRRDVACAGDPDSNDTREGQSILTREHESQSSGQQKIEKRDSRLEEAKPVEELKAEAKLAFEPKVEEKPMSSEKTLESPDLIVDAPPDYGVLDDPARDLDAAFAEVGEQDNSGETAAQATPSNAVHAAHGNAAAAAAAAVVAKEAVAAVVAVSIIILQTELKACGDSSSEDGLAAPTIGVAVDETPMAAKAVVAGVRQQLDAAADTHLTQCVPEAVESSSPRNDTVLDSDGALEYSTTETPVDHLSKNSTLSEGFLSSNLSSKVSGQGLELDDAKSDTVPKDSQGNCEASDPEDGIAVTSPPETPIARPLSADAAAGGEALSTSPELSRLANESNNTEGGSAASFADPELERLQASVESLKAQVRSYDIQKKTLTKQVEDSRKLVWEHRLDADRARQALKAVIIAREGENPAPPELCNTQQAQTRMSSSSNARDGIAGDLAIAPMRRAGAKGKPRQVTVQEFLEENDVQMKHVCDDLNEARSLAASYWRTAEEQGQALQNLEREVGIKQALQALKKHPAGEVFLTRAPGQLHDAAHIPDASLPQDETFQDAAAPPSVAFEGARPPERNSALGRIEEGAEGDVELSLEGCSVFEDSLARVDTIGQVPDQRSRASAFLRRMQWFAERTAKDQANALSTLRGFVGVHMAADYLKASCQSALCQWHLLKLRERSMSRQIAAEAIGKRLGKELLIQAFGALTDLLEVGPEQQAALIIQAQCRKFLSQQKLVRKQKAAVRRKREANRQAMLEQRCAALEREARELQLVAVERGWQNDRVLSYVDEETEVRQILEVLQENPSLLDQPEGAPLVERLEVLRGREEQRAALLIQSSVKGAFCRNHLLQLQQEKAEVAGFHSASPSFAEGTLSQRLDVFCKKLEPLLKSGTVARAASLSFAFKRLQSLAGMHFAVLCLQSKIRSYSAQRDLQCLSSASQSLKHQQGQISGFWICKEPLLEDKSKNAYYSEEVKRVYKLSPDGTAYYTIQKLCYEELEYDAARWTERNGGSGRWDLEDNGMLVIECAVGELDENFEPTNSARRPHLLRMKFHMFQQKYERSDEYMHESGDYGSTMHMQSPESQYQGLLAQLTEQKAHTKAIEEHLDSINHLLGIGKHAGANVQTSDWNETQLASSSSSSCSDTSPRQGPSARGPPGVLWVRNNGAYGVPRSEGRPDFVPKLGILQMAAEEGSEDYGTAEEPGAEDGPWAWQPVPDQDYYDIGLEVGDFNNTTRSEASPPLPPGPSMPPPPLPPEGCPPLPPEEPAPVLPYEHPADHLVKALSDHLNEVHATVVPHPLEMPPPPEPPVEIEDEEAEVNLEDIAGGITVLPNLQKIEREIEASSLKREEFLLSLKGELPESDEKVDRKEDFKIEESDLDRQVDDNAEFVTDADLAKLEDQVQDLTREIHGDEQDNAYMSNVHSAMGSSVQAASQSIPKMGRPTDDKGGYAVDQKPEAVNSCEGQTALDLDPQVSRFEPSPKLVEPTPQPNLHHVMKQQSPHAGEAVPNLQPSQLQPDPEPPMEAGLMPISLADPTCGSNPQFDNLPAYKFHYLQISQDGLPEGGHGDKWAILDGANIRAAGPNGHRWIKQVDAVVQTDFSLQHALQPETRTTHHVEKRPRSVPTGSSNKARGEPLKSALRSKGDSKASRIPRSASASKILQKANSAGNPGQRQTNDKRGKPRRVKSAVTFGASNTQKFFNEAAVLGNPNDVTLKFPRDTHSKPCNTHLQHPQVQHPQVQHQHVHHHAHFMVETPPAPGEHVVFPLRPRKDRILTSPEVF
jgi:hypothetical protein